MLKRLTSTLVIDHVGKISRTGTARSPGISHAAYGLVDGGRTWVKLSAPYEVSKVGPPNCGDVGKLAKALAKAAPNGCYGPPIGRIRHQASQVPDDALMLDMLLDWVPDENARKKSLGGQSRQALRLLTNHGLKFGR